MPYEIPTSLPWDRFAGAWEAAEEALVRLDQALAGSALKGAWLRRADFEEAAAALWLEGELVPLEELVLYDARTNAKLPTPEMFRARALLLSRRSLARQRPAESLTRAGILALQARRQRLTEPSPETAELLDDDSDWDPASRVEAWLALLPDLQAIPALPAAAIALHAWDQLAPFQGHNTTIGRLLMPVYLWQRGKTQDQVLCLCLGLKALGWIDRADQPLASWLPAFCGAVARAAAAGLKRHRQLGLAQSLMARRLEGRRASSRLPALIQLILERPLVSAPLVAKELKISQQAAGGLLGELVDAGAVRELTGRSRFRAYGIA